MMAVEKVAAQARGLPQKRKIRENKKGKKAKKKPKMVQGALHKKIDPKMKKLFRKRAKEYNSDDEDDDDNKDSGIRERKADVQGLRADGISSPGEMKDGHDDDMSADGISDEDGEIQPGITKFTEGCRAFKIAFKTIIKKTASDGPLGPVLSAHKNLVAEKLIEEEAEKKRKGEAKKQKHLIAETGHVKPPNYLDSHEKFLIGVATKGVVKLFNAVNKAQSAQKGLNPSRSKDAKVIRKKRKETFFSELGKPSLPSGGDASKEQSLKGPADECPAWAPLRDNYMLTSSKLKDWDKKTDPLSDEDTGRMSVDSSSDDD